MADDGYVTSVIRQWDRRDWGEGGVEFHWWCTEDARGIRGDAARSTRNSSPRLVALSGQEDLQAAGPYLQARAQALGEPAVGPTPVGAAATSPVMVGTTRNGARKDHEEGSSPVPVRLPHPALRRSSVEMNGVRSVGDLVVLLRGVGVGLKMSSNSVSAIHHEACSSSGSAPHSGHRLPAVATERFRLRASSKRRCRPFFTSDSSVGRGASLTARTPSECTRHSARPRSGPLVLGARPPCTAPVQSWPCPRISTRPAMIERFRSRAVAVRSGASRPSRAPSDSASWNRRSTDYMDYAMLGDAEAAPGDGILTLRIDLRARRPGGPEEPDPSAAVIHAGVVHGEDIRRPTIRPRWPCVVLAPTSTTSPTNQVWLPSGRRDGPHSRTRPPPPPENGRPGGGAAHRLCRSSSLPPVIFVDVHLRSPASRSAGRGPGPGGPRG